MKIEDMIKVDKTIYTVLNGVKNLGIGSISASLVDDSMIIPGRSVTTITILTPDEKNKAAIMFLDQTDQWFTPNNDMKDKLDYALEVARELEALQVKGVRLIRKILAGEEKLLEKGQKIPDLKSKFIEE